MAEKNRTVNRHPYFSKRTFRITPNNPSKNSETKNYQNYTIKKSIVRIYQGCDSQIKKCD
jgi:hypothetical protein